MHVFYSFSGRYHPKTLFAVYKSMFVHRRQVTRHGAVRRSVALLCLAFGVVSSAWALDPANVRMGPLYLVPTLDVETAYTDNLFRSQSDQEVDTWFVTTLPKVQGWLQNGPNTYSLALQLEDFRYASSHDDDFTDYQANLDLHHEFNARNVLDVVAQWYDGHEERGTGLSEGNVVERIDEPVELETLDYGFKYTFGSRETPGRIEAAYKNFDRQYQNFRNATQFRDYSQDEYRLTGYWAVGARTDLLAEIRYFDTAYDEVNRVDPNGSFDSEEYDYYLGASWQATARTTGSVRLGYFEREYDSIARQDDDGFSWEVDIDYRPRTYSAVNLETRRFTQETNGFGDAIDTQEYAVRWDHDWNSRQRTVLRVLYADDDYTGSGEREDDRYELEAKYTHAMRRWLDISGGYRYEKRNSEQEDLDYSRNLYFVEFNLSL